MSSRDGEPNSETADVNGGKKRGSILSVTSGDGAPAFEMKEGIFDQVAKLIEMAVIFALEAAVSFGRNDGSHSSLGGQSEDGIGVVATIRQKIGGAHSLDKSASLSAISLGAFCNKDSERQTMRIHGQMQFGIEPPFVRLMA